MELQKASIWKRISAFLLDFILMVILVSGMAYMLSGVLDYDSYAETVEQRYEYYSQEYGIDLNMGAKEYSELSKEQQQLYEDANEALLADEQARQAYNMGVSIIVLITSLSVLLAYVVLEFVIPLMIGNGQTLGKKVFGLAVMMKNGVKISGVSLFIRTFLGKYTIETMLPLMILFLIILGTVGSIGTMLAMLLLGAQAILLTTGDSRVIHDRMSSSVVVDYASQKIFGSNQELLDYLKKTHAEEAAAEEY